MSDNSNSAGARPPKPRWKRWLPNLALALGTFLVCVGLLEVALRVAGYGNLEIYEPDAKLYWKLKPDQDCFTKVGHKRVHINSHGTRGPEFSADKPANTIRILSLGDSRTFGWGLADEETYSRRLEQLLREFEGRNIQPRTSTGEPPTSNAPLTPALSPSDGERGNRFQLVGEVKRVEVINAGVNAWSYSQMLVFYRDFAAAWKPDLVILGEANPWTQFSEKNSSGFVKQFMGRVRLKNFLRRFAIYHFVVEVKLQEFYMRHRTKFIPVDPQQDALFKEQQQSDPDAVFRSAIEGLCQTARSNGVKATLVFLPTLDELQSTNRSPVLAAKLAVSARLGVPLVDLTPKLAAGGKALYLEADPVHLNAAGNAIVALRLLESMTNHLGQ
jgi:hypothetical protein